MPPNPSKPCTFYDGRRYDVSESVGHQLISLTLMMRREVDRRMVQHDLTDAQWKPLYLIKLGRATTANELARLMDIDAGAITRMLDRLESKGLLERVRSEADRRVVHLRLTAAGDAVAKKVPFVLASVNNDFLRGFSEAEWKQLRRLLGRMAENGALLQDESAAA
jgi:DNA-binding MarR family transcriptional regulator